MLYNYKSKEEFVIFILTFVKINLPCHFTGPQLHLVLDLTLWQVKLV